MERTESQDLRDFRVYQVHQVFLVTKGPLVNREFKEMPVFQDNKAQEEILERMDDLVTMVFLAHLVQLEIEEHQEVRVQEASKACQVPLVRMEWLEKMERLAFKDHLE